MSQSTILSEVNKDMGEIFGCFTKATIEIKGQQGVILLDL
jgi:hypothetical protein